MKTILYKIDKKGTTRYWQCEAVRDGLEFEFGVLGGEKQTDSEPIEYGRANRTQWEQIVLRLRSRASNKVKKGYRPTIEEAREDKGNNELGLPLPMLAHKVKDVNLHDLGQIYAQRKYNGHRCLIANMNRKVTAYSRGGEVITSISHIVDELDIPDGHVLDGELYHHGTKLQTIGSWVRREQDNTLKLKYVVYDSIMPDRKATFTDRFWNLRDIVDANKPVNTVLADTMEIRPHEVFAWFDEFRKEKYEGAIVRSADGWYEAGERSYFLIKVKAFDDAEFEVWDIFESPDGWAILVCAVGNGKKFRVTAPGTHEEKAAIFKNRKRFIGKYITVEYDSFTDSGVPSQPIAKEWRRDI